jgi:hypothetical protein
MTCDTEADFYAADPAWVNQSQRDGACEWHSPFSDAARVLLRSLQSGGCEPGLVPREYQENGTHASLGMGLRRILRWR